MTAGPPELLALAPGEALLVLLVAGHLLADFLFQTREMVETKREGPGLLRHGAVVFVVQAAAAAPFLSLSLLGAAAGIALLHAAIDALKVRRLSASFGALAAFGLDQLLHLLVVGGAWALLTRGGAPAPAGWASAGVVGAWAGVALLASAFAFNATGGSVLVEGILGWLPGLGAAGDEGGAGFAGAGRLIGILERTLALALVLYGQWAAVALLVTAKSIARFEELKERRFAEYYLVGTLASLLVAFGVAFLLTGVVLPLLG